jgi:hypothetical protein
MKTSVNTIGERLHPGPTLAEIPRAKVRISLNRKCTIQHPHLPNDEVVGINVFQLNNLLRLDYIFGILTLTVSDLPRGHTTFQKQLIGIAYHRDGASIGETLRPLPSGVLRLTHSHKDNALMSPHRKVTCRTALYSRLPTSPKSRDLHSVYFQQVRSSRCYKYKVTTF